ncbi:MAG: ferritin family protein [Phycisphaerae bacterium]|nr:ferritin family protein [Phycisphaerae bacterium]
MKFETFDQVVDYAIDREIQARLFYLHLAHLSEDPELRALLEVFANEELAHQKKLAKVKQRQFKMLDGDMPAFDLGIADAAPEVAPYPDMSVSEALVLAMNKEKTAYRLYLELSQGTDNPELKTLFEGLANEEANHKVRMEIEFDDHLMKSDSTDAEAS